jgi:hypothetical protein
LSLLLADFCELRVSAFETRNSGKPFSFQSVPTGIPPRESNKKIRKRKANDLFLLPFFYILNKIGIEWRGTDK